jgi:hypothetical protein
MHRPSARALRITLGLSALIVLGLFGSSAMAQGANKYNNPYINDGSFTDPPITFDFNVTEVRNRFDEHDKRWLDHIVTEDYEAVVANLKGRYRKRQPIAPGYIIRGFAFLTIPQRWSFNIGKEGTNLSFVVLVGPSERGSGSVLSILAYTNTKANARFKRAWYGFSPAGMDEYAVSVHAY